MRLALIAALAAAAFAQPAGGPVVRAYDEIDWKVSPSLPAGPSGHDYHLVYEDKRTNGVQTLVRFAKGYALPEHTHSSDETIVVLSGKLELETGGSRRVLGPGSFAVLPAGTPHTLRAAGWGRCQMLVSFSGAPDFKGLPGVK